MKVLTCTSPGELRYDDLPYPEEQKGNAVVRVEKIGICGTDLHAFEGTQPYFSYPRILGHELSGTIQSSGSFKTGERIAVMPYFSCGVCHACRQGKTNCCTSLNVFGVHIDGGMREYISVPERFLVKSDLNAESLALVEPLAIGAHAVRRADVKDEQTVLVVGVGPIGLGVASFAKIAGARVIILDVNDGRLEFSRNHSQADHVIDGRASNVIEQLRELTNGAMPDVVFDATGNLNAINNSFQFLSHGGKYVLVGLQKGLISVSHPEFHKREGTLMSSRNATRDDFDYVIRCISEKRIHPLEFVTHRVNFTDVKSDFASWLDPKTGVVKVLVSF